MSDRMADYVDGDDTYNSEILPIAIKRGNVVIVKGISALFRPGFIPKFV